MVLHYIHNLTETQRGVCDASCVACRMSHECGRMRRMAWGSVGSGKGDVVIRVLNCLCSFQLRYLDGDVNIDIKYR